MPTDRIVGGLAGGTTHVTTIPKKTEAGNPDFRVWNGQDRIISYILPRGDGHSANHRLAGRD